MSIPRVVITAVVLEGRPKGVVAREYGVSRWWVQVLVTRYLAEGETVFDPRRCSDMALAVGLVWAW